MAGKIKEREGRGGGGSDERGEGKDAGATSSQQCEKNELTGRKDDTSSPPPHLESLLLAHGLVALKQNQGIPS